MYMHMRTAPNPVQYALGQPPLPDLGSLHTQAGPFCALHWSLRPSNNGPPHTRTTACDAVACPVMHCTSALHLPTHHTQHAASSKHTVSTRGALQHAAPGGIRECIRTVSCTLQRSTPDTDGPDASASSNPVALLTRYPCHGRRPTPGPKACSPRCREMNTKTNTGVSCRGVW
jgi:hypothetical protein